MTQQVPQQQEQLPTWRMILVIIVAPFFAIVILPIVALTSPIALDMTTIDIILGAGGIAIGLIIAFYQHKQGKRMERILVEVHVLREARRKNFRLTHIRNQTSRIRNMADRIANLIEEVIDNRNRTHHQWARITRNIDNIIALIDPTRNSVRDHFAAIDDLMRHPGLAGRFDGDMWAIGHVLAVDIRHINDPIDDPDDRQDLVDPLQELRNRIGRFDDLLILLDEEEEPEPDRNR
ncbi:MAG: hypothetical protein ACREAS_05275 [Nitrososphaera sp.]